MSKGIGGSARIVMQDVNTVIYEYYAYDLDNEACRNPEHIYDGTITIDKRSLVESEIHEKLKKLPKGRKKLITKRVLCDVDFSSRIAAGQISVENSKFCWKFLDNDIGMIAMHLIWKIFRLYQTEGTIPETVGYHV
ncbi:MAG: hypothetical protein IJY71_05560 [Clostridia bacterium]|nr:hypothetical protein [Clostridia bacterium]